MRILVTWASGYIASNLIPLLRQKKHQIVTYDILEGQNITNRYKLAGYIRGCDAVIHLAAVVGIAPCRDNVSEAIRTNVQGTQTIVELAEKNKIPVIFASTYAAINPQTVYGQTKLLGEALVLNAGGTVLRMANIYGGTGCLKKGSVVSAFERKRRKGEYADIYGGGVQKCDFIHVDDVCRAFVRALHAEPGFYLVCTDIETSIIELAMIMDVKHHILSSKEKPVAKEKWLNGWIPEVSLEEGLKQVVCESS